MARKTRENASGSTATATEAASRRQKRLSLTAYNNRLSGATRTFRDPFEVDVDVRRRFSTTGHSSSSTMAGGTRAARHPSLVVGMPWAAIRRSRSPSFVDSGSGITSRMLATTTEVARESATTVAVERRASAPTRAGRRVSIQEWWAAKVGVAVRNATQTSESLHGSEREGFLEDEHDNTDRPRPGDERDYYDEASQSAMADVPTRENMIEADVDDKEIISPASSIDVNDPCAEASRDFQTYLEGEYDSGSGRSTDMSGHGEVGMSPLSTSFRRISRGDDEGGDPVPTTGQELHQTNDEEETAFDRPAAVVKDIYSNTSEHGEPRRVAFLSGTLGLTVDTTVPICPHPSDDVHCKEHSQHQQQQRTHADREEWPASPCSGVILETSPRYGSLQAFRKEMSSRGIDAQMFHTGWKARFLPPRDIRLFLTDSRKSSVLFWRYKKKSRGGRRGTAATGDLGPEDRRVIPLSSLANIGPAEVYRRSASATRGRSSRRRSSWVPIGAPLRWGAEESADNRGDSQGKDLDSCEKDETCTLGPEEDVPVVALSYWGNGEPRWEGDKPKRLLVKPESFDTFQRLTNGLRLCCLHFYNHSCPQDLEDIR